MKKASILIVNWNGLKHLQACMDSLMKQTYTNYEIIFIDNDSNDGSVKFIKDNYKDIKIIQLERNYGFAEANNIGIKNSDGEYIVFLNNDTEVDKHWLEEMINAINSDKKIGYVNSKMIMFNNREYLDNAGVSYTISGSVIEYGRYEKCSKYKDEYKIPIACAGSAMYKKELIDKIGGFDNNFFISYEDIDLSLRSLWAGYIGIYAPKSIVYHKLKASRESNLDLFTYYNQRNNSYVWYKNIPYKLKVKYFIPRAIYNFGSMIYSIKQGTFRPYVKAKVDFYKNRKKIDKVTYKIINENEFDTFLRKDFLSNKLKKLLENK